MFTPKIDREGDEQREAGFTLIELMVVVLIIAILIAVAIPTFLGARERAQDRAVQSSVRNAFTAEKVLFTDAQAYSAVVADLDAVEPALTFVAANSIPDTTAAEGNTYVHVASGVVYVGMRSAAGDCFVLRDDPAGTVGTEFKTDADCGDMTGGPAASWLSKW